MATEQDQVRNIFNEGSSGGAPVTFDGIPLDDFTERERKAQAQGRTLLRNDDGTPFDPQAPNKGEQNTRLFRETSRKEISNNYAWNRGHEDALLNGDLSTTSERAQAYSQNESVKDDLVEFLYSMYTEDHLDYGVLQDLEGFPPDQQIARIMQEVERHDLRKLNSKQHLLIHMMRNGFGDMPTKATEEIWLSLRADELEALGKKLEQDQIDQLRRDVDEVVAPLGTDLTAQSLVGDILQQDFIPIYGAVTRVATTKAFLPKGVELGGFRGLLPGEIRQEIREWFADASHEDRIEYIRDISQEVDKLRKGPNAKHFTRYGILEQMIGIFTEDLLQDNLPKDTLDRVMGNLDVLLEALYGIAVVSKLGSGLNGLFRTTSSSSVRNAAKAAGNNAAVASLDNQIRRVAEGLDLDPVEAAVIDLPRPPGLRDNLEVLPDGVKEVIEESEAIRLNVLDSLDDITGQGLLKQDKQNVVAKLIEELDWGDTVHVNHRMMTIEELPNDVGVRISGVIGETPTGGWRYFDDMVDELIDLDPRLESFEIVKRGPTGNVEKVNVTPDELARFVTKKEVPPEIEVDLAPESASSRLFGGRVLTTVPKDDLIKTAETLDPAGPDFENILKELERRADGIDTLDPLKTLDGNEYYLRFTQDRFWHPLDKEGFHEESFLHAGSSVTPLFAPNAKFGDDIYGAFLRVYHKEQAAIRDFDRIYKPFYDLNAKDKIAVQNLFEWAEDFAKAQGDRGLARAPTFEELVANFGDVSTAQLRGYAAIREGLDLQYELFNRRLYRDFKTRGLQTIRPSTGDTPNYHGIPMARDSARPGLYFDPIANEMKSLNSTQLDDVFNAGGSIIKLDFPLDAPNGGKYTRVLAQAGDYELGPLSRRPLNYYEGYHMRFYEDPVYIVKHTKGSKVDGRPIDDEIEEAIRTAGSSPEAVRYINKYSLKEKDALGRFLDKNNPNISYSVKPAKNINNTEGTLFQSQALYREGRLFWDKRNSQRLPDVNGNRARVEDLSRGIQKGTALAIRQTTHEDLFTTLKRAFGREYRDLIDPADLATKDIRTIITELRSLRSEKPALKARINTAIMTAKYLRVQMGTDSLVVPILREQVISAANWIARLGVRYDSKTLTKMGGWAEKWGQSVDPFRAARSVAFHAFMVFRPVRQLLLQSAQISYLLPLDPSYIGTGRVFKDSYALRRGVRAFQHSNYKDGWADKDWADLMGLSKKEYKRVVEEFNRSGLLETVDVHAFNPTAKQARRVPLRDTPLSRGYYRFRGATQRTRQVFQSGFDIGERNNLTFTYMVALRRALKNGEGNILSLTRKEWDAVTQDASNLALAMTRPNKFGYQSGMPGMVTQFLSFSHKAFLGMIGKNPSIPKDQVWKMWGSMYALYGANMFGAEDFAREQLSKIGITRKSGAEIVPGITLADVLAAGMIETGFNAIVEATLSEKDRLDLSFLAPGVNVVQIWQSVLEGVTESPETLALGPFYNPASGFLKGMEFTTKLVQYSDRPPGEKFVKAADALVRNTLPGYNDANRALLAYQMGQWMDKDGDKLPLRPTWLQLIARGTLGVRSESEIAYYRLQNAAWEQVENINNAVDVNKTFLKELLTGWQGKVYGDEYIYEQVAVLNSLYEAWPEGIRREIFIRSLTEGDPENPSVVEILAKMSNSGSVDIVTILPWIEAQADMTPKEREQLTELVKDIQAGYEGADKAFQDLQLMDRNIN